MERDRNEWLWPLTGLLFAVLLIISLIVQGSPKGADKPANEVAQWYIDNKDSAEISAFIGTVAAVPLIFFGAYLRKVLEGAGSTLAVLPLIGLTVVGIGGAIDNMLLFATAERANDISAESVRTIQAIWDNDFLPIALGVMVFLFSFGIAVVRSGALPKWLGWVAIALGIVALIPPIGFAAFIGTALIILIVSILLAVRARSEAAPA